MPKATISSEPCLFELWYPFCCAHLGLVNTPTCHHKDLCQVLGLERRKSCRNLVLGQFSQHEDLPGGLVFGAALPMPSGDLVPPQGGSPGRGGRRYCYYLSIYLSLSILYIYIYIYTYIHTYINEYMHMCTSTHTYIYIYVCMCVCIYIYIYIYVCMYTYICIYTCIQSGSQVTVVNPCNPTGVMMPAAIGAAEDLPLLINNNIWATKQILL